MSNKTDKKTQNILRSIPSVDRVINCPELSKISMQIPKWLLVATVRGALEELRKKYLNEGKRTGDNPAQDEVITEIINIIKDTLTRIQTPSMTKVINGTGVIIHTNLGRAPLAPEAIRLINEVAQGYSNLEYALSLGNRSKRGDNVHKLLLRLTGAKNAFVVNNNAGAVLLALNSLAEGGEVIVSRGELVEIGGSFRIPDVMNKSGARMKEVGTTNRTHLCDYENAITKDSTLLLKVHTSNYKIVGFSAEVSLTELVELGAAHNIPVMMDLGSGNLTDLSQLGLKGEPPISEILSTGVDIVTFSGDKLLGGPQAGVILTQGKVEISKIITNPLARTLRIGKLTLAALEATLLLYQQKNYIKSIPILKMISTGIDEIKTRAQKVFIELERINSGFMQLEIKEGFTNIGGGALPAESIPTLLITFSSGRISIEQLEEAFRLSSPPVLGRIKGKRILLDLRTIMEDEIPVLIEVYKSIVKSHI